MKMQKTHTFTFISVLRYSYISPWLIDHHLKRFIYDKEYTTLEEKYYDDKQTLVNTHTGTRTHTQINNQKPNFKTKFNTYSHGLASNC